MEINKDKSQSSIWNIFYVVFNWIYKSEYPNELYTENMNDGEINDLLKGWEWILTSAEQFAQKQNEHRAKELINELKILKKMSNTISIRPKIGQLIQNYLNTLDKEILIKLINSRLDSSKRNNIIKTIIQKVQKKWLQTFIQLINKSYLNNHINLILNQNNKVSDSFIKHHIETLNKLKNNWYEEKYQKNICGELISLSFQSSHPSESKGLTYITLSDILWSIYLCLSRQLTDILNRPLFIIEIDILFTLINEISIELINEWIITIDITGNINTRSGLLPKKWKEDHIKHEIKIQQIKKLGVDAKFNDGPSDSLWRNHYFNSNVPDISLLDNQSFNQRKSLLQNNLIFRLNK